MKAIHYWMVLCTILMAVGPVSSQVVPGIPQPARITREQLTQIVKNTRKLQVRVTLDRDSYFPGEEPTATITVENRTPQVLEVLDPMQIGRLNLMVRDPSKLKSWGTEWVHLDPERGAAEELGLDAPSRFLNPSEKIQIDYSSPDRCMENKLGRG